MSSTGQVRCLQHLGLGWRRCVHIKASQIGRAFGTGSGATLMEEAARANMAMFERALQMFPGFGFTRAEPTAAPAPTSAEPEPAAKRPEASDGLDEMRRQMDEMRAQIEKLAGAKPETK